MQCNIDAKGKAIRLVVGLITLAIGLVLFILTVQNVIPSWGYYISVGTCAGGAFATFEGWHGWCALRAIGMKTPW